MGWVNGFLAVMVLGMLSYGLSFLSPVFDPLVLGITIGIIVSNLFETGTGFDRGIGRALKCFLPIGISLYGFQLRFERGLSIEGIWALYGVFLMILVLGLLVTRRLFPLSQNASILISSGLSVCGATAIAVISPAIGARREETSVSILAVMTGGIIYTILYPLLKDAGLIGEGYFAFLTGSTLPMLGLVKAAASQVDGGVLGLAVKYKFLRIASLVFMVALAVLFSGIRKGFLKVPWFMILFIVFALMTNFIAIPPEVVRGLGKTATLFLTLTLTAIGLRTDLGAVVEMGLRPFFSAILVLSFAAVIVIFLGRTI